MASSSPVEYDIDGEKYKEIFENNRKKLLRSVDPTEVLIDSISAIQPLARKLDGIKSQTKT